MKINQFLIKNTESIPVHFAALGDKPQLILVFGAKEFFSHSDLAKNLLKQFPQSVIAGCSTAGEIGVDKVHDGSCILTAVHFHATQVKAVTTPLHSMEDSQAAGERLATSIDHQNLTAVMIFSTGVAINGSALVTGLQRKLPPEVRISGGLAGDGGSFTQTWTLGPSGVKSDHLVLIGYYGNKVKFHYGTFAGWEPFGPARRVTRSEENILYELDGEPALNIYKRYLGDYAKDLPGSGLLFPFEMLNNDREKQGIFRTILGINPADNSLTLAGDIIPNGYLRLMHASTDKLISGAEKAAQIAKEHAHPANQSLAILVSCIGRKLVMGDRVDEEVEAVADTLGNNTAITGFYSNGEIANNSFLGECRLHNQTMTITWITEIS